MTHDGEGRPGLRASFRDTLQEQMHSALARRIQAKVHDARSDPDRAARRWAFELVQNAHDAGPRPGRDGVSISFDYSENVLSFEHDAAPFKMDEVAALLTGGSSKDFTSSDTTGRFGTGFLVTHALSERVDVRGVLEEESDLHAFEVALDRSNGEEGILKNMLDSESALDQTRAVNDFEKLATARLTYAVDDDEVATVGLTALRASLPHLFGSCPRLTGVKVRTGQGPSEWVVVRRDHRTTQDLRLTEISVLEQEGDSTIEWRVVRAEGSGGGRGRVLIALREDNGDWQVAEPGPGPSVFRQQPVLGAPSLRSWIVLDGDFDVDQERSTIFVKGEGAEPLREAIRTVGPLTALGVEEGWKGAHRIAHLTPLPEDAIGANASEVWNQLLREGAEILSELPIVPTADGRTLPAVAWGENEFYADFLETEPPAPSHGELWRLAAACTALDPPSSHVSAEWSEIASGWADLEVDVTFVDLRAIGEAAASDSETLEELAVVGEPLSWLVKYLDAVGKRWTESEAVTKGHVAGLLPNQHGALFPFGELRRDGGVDERLKDIAARINVDIRARLLDRALFEKATELKADSALDAIVEATGSEVTSDDVADEVVQALTESLPEDQTVTDDGQSIVPLSIELLNYLWDTRGSEGRHHAWKVPLIAADKRARRPSHQRLMMRPANSWPETARSFSSAYPPSRILSDHYSHGEDGGSLLEALTEWGIAHEQLLHVGRRERLSDRALHAIAANPDEVLDATAREVEFTQISLLEPEVLNFAKQSRERAEALLGLVVCHVAAEDQSWREESTLTLKNQEGDLEVKVTPSLWLSDLRSKPWIPVEDGQSVTHHVPNPELLRDLLDANWLAENPAGVDLLIRHFGLDALDVRLLAVAVDDEARQQVRDELARIVDLTRADPEAIHRLADEAAARDREVSRMRSLGLAVQACVKHALEEYGVTVENIDRGFDFLVSDVRVRQDEHDDVSVSFDVGAYKVEVKATSSGEAKLTPMQAGTAATEPSDFVLCVVDLRAFPEDVHQVDWTPETVEPYCKLISGEDLTIEKTVRLVQSAEGSDVPIRNASALRYAVRAEAWSEGLSLESWLREAFPTDLGGPTEP